MGPYSSYTHGKREINSLTLILRQWICQYGVASSCKDASYILSVFALHCQKLTHSLSMEKILLTNANDVEMCQKYECVLHQ
jgi:hypothetical protein